MQPMIATTTFTSMLSPPTKIAGRRKKVYDLLSAFRLWEVTA